MKKSKEILFAMLLTSEAMLLVHSKYKCEGDYLFFDSMRVWYLA